MKTLLEALPLRERPAWRVAYQADGCSLVELLAALVGGPRQIEVAQALMARMQDLDQERLVVLLLDTRNRLMGAPVEVYHGSVNSTLVRVGEVFRPAVRANAASAIVAHNHPSGDPSPSPEDLAFTRRLSEGGELVGVRLVDHLILGGVGRWVSLRERGAW